MIQLKNVALDRLRAGQLAIGIGLRQSRTVDIAKAMRTAGFCVHRYRAQFDGR